MKDVKQSITGPCYTGADRKKLIDLATVKMKPLVDYLGKKDFLFGNDMTFLDFYMLELCEFADWLTENTFLNANKPLNRYIKRMKGQKRVKAYMRSENFMQKPFNNLSAKINNV